MLLYIGTAAASRVFNEALAKIAVNAQQGGTTDIGKCNQPTKFNVELMFRFWLSFFYIVFDYLVL